MIIPHPSHHTWYKILAEDPLSQFGKNSIRKICASKEKLSAFGVSIRESEVDDALLEWFTPLYEDSIQRKDHPFTIDIRSKMLEDKERYHALCLYQDGVPLGAMLFTLRRNKLSLAYRMFAADWHREALPASPSLLMEYEISVLAQRHAKKALIHGKDRNPHGLNSSIGLAAFKLASGCKVRIPSQFTVAELDTATLKDDVLVMRLPEKTSRRITKSCLITTEEDLPKYGQLLKYPHLLEIEVLYRS